MPALAKKSASAKKAAPAKKAATTKKAAAPAKKIAPAKKAASAKKTAPAQKLAPSKKKAPSKKAAPAKKAVPAKKAAPAKKATPARRRTPNAAFMKSQTPSAALAAIVGSAPLARSAVVARVWQYIRSNNLQSATNPKAFKVDAKLRAVVEEDTPKKKRGDEKKKGPNPGPSIKPAYTMFEFSKALSRNLK